MEESILKSTKKILGLDADYTPFDLDIITHINTAFSILNQLGNGPEEGFSIVDDTEVWNDYDAPQNQLNLIKTYVFLKVRLLFDPPGTSFVLTAFENQVKEYEWRLNVMREYALAPDVTPNEPNVTIGGVRMTKSQFLAARQPLLNPMPDEEVIP